MMTLPPTESSRAYQALYQGNYQQAAGLYEQAIAAEPTIHSHYWYLGVALLLQGQELEAQTTWLLAMEEAESEEVEALTQDLVSILQTEAERFSQQADPASAWLIRQHLRELVPGDLANLLALVQLSIQQETYTGDELEEWGVIASLADLPSDAIPDPLFWEMLTVLLQEAVPHPSTVALIEAYLPHCPDPIRLMEALLQAVVRWGYQTGHVNLAIDLAKLCLQFAPDQFGALAHLAALYQRTNRYEEALFYAMENCRQAQTNFGKAIATANAIRCLMIAGGFWQRVDELFREFEALLGELVEHPEQITADVPSALLTATSILPYMRDDLAGNRRWHNQISYIGQQLIQHTITTAIGKQYFLAGAQPRSQAGRPLKIGYISGFLRRHSVGWLARWLFQHHDPAAVQVYSYLINIHPDDPCARQWFADRSYQAHYLGINPIEIADQIEQDEIDILIDLDSLTLDISCQVMALKPAPIQATWLGWDASGIPTVDYFIADPYVLSESAQAHYVEKIWRLPQTFIAVDGFEIGIPDLRRDTLGIPNDAVIYFSGQKGHKRHPDTVKLQMQILRQVPNSFFLVKGISDQNAIQTFFQDMATAAGVAVDRIRFLPESPTEAVHRANLAIADVILDTYPYSGATTTLEALWMGRPLVTRVGEQFSSRNAYSMMVNAGLSEGIAWTDAEYVEWGVKLGQDDSLRQQISWKLHQSRQTSPLWNGPQFAREMERAYQEMWAQYWAKPRS